MTAPSVFAVRNVKMIVMSQSTRSENCSKNLHKWTTESKNWVVYARLNTPLDAEAGDVHYHTSCYTKLKNDAHALMFKSSNAKQSSQNQKYNLFVIAQLVAFVQFNHSAFKLADLRMLYDRRLQQLGSDWIGANEHQKRFKEHLLDKLELEWSEYSNCRDVYISHKKAVDAALAQTAGY